MSNSLIPRFLEAVAVSDGSNSITRLGEQFMNLLSMTSPDVLSHFPQTTKDHGHFQK